MVSVFITKGFRCGVCRDLGGVCRGPCLLLVLQRHWSLISKQKILVEFLATLTISSFPRVPILNVISFNASEFGVISSFIKTYFVFCCIYEYVDMGITVPMFRCPQSSEGTVRSLGAEVAGGNGFWNPFRSPARAMCALNHREFSREKLF